MVTYDLEGVAEDLLMQEAYHGKMGESDTVALDIICREPFIEKFLTRIPKNNRTNVRAVNHAGINGAPEMRYVGITYAHRKNKPVAAEALVILGNRKVCITKSTNTAYVVEIHDSLLMPALSGMLHRKRSDEDTSPLVDINSSNITFYERQHLQTFLRRLADDHAI